VLARIVRDTSQIEGALGQPLIWVSRRPTCRAIREKPAGAVEMQVLSLKRERRPPVARVTQSDSPNARDGRSATSERLQAQGLRPGRL